MKSYFVLTILISIALISCKKKRTVTIQAENYITGNGADYAGASYSVEESYGSIANANYNTVAGGVLDENGRAVFEVKITKSRRYELTVEWPENVCYTGFKTYQLLDKTADNDLTIYHGPCGYLNLEIVNGTCAGSDDKFWYKEYFASNQDVFINSIHLNSEGSWADDVYLEGCVDQSPSYLYYARPVGIYNFDWRVERSNGITFGSSTITIEEGDTTFYKLEY